MSNKRFVEWILFFVLILNVSTMNAQNNADSLNAQQRGLITISALTATGDLEKLKIQLNAGLDAGLTVNEINEAVVQLYAYCGFPRSLNAISTFMQVMEDRKAKGITDVRGRDTTPLEDNTDKYELGRKTLETLTKTPQAKPAPGFGEFAPRIDAFLKEHLFADVFSSNVLNFRQRELVTISALASLTGVEAQLQAHITMGKNTGITDLQLEQLADIIEAKVNRTQANTIRKIIGRQQLPIIEKDLMVRISEIEIVPEFLDEYKAILKEEASASVEIEKGVIAIFPMYQQQNPSQVRIVEIYAGQDAYQKHLQTPHFKHYKTTTLKMVKGLKLVDMNEVDKATMQLIFKKLK